MTDERSAGSRPGHQPVPAGNQPAPPVYQPIPPGYQQVPPGYQQVPPGYQQVPPGYQPIHPNPYAQFPAVVRTDEPTGQLCWAAGFLIAIPFFGVFAAITIALATRVRARASGAHREAGNATNAANFLLSYLIYSFVTGCGSGVTSIITDPTHTSHDLHPLALILSWLWFASGIWALVVLIIGTVKSRTRVFAAYPCIPFVRP